MSCASLPDDVAESELFGYAGYEENAAPKRGVLEQADGGTVFLDEVGNVDSATTKLLRFTRRYLPKSR